jgi:hypothetical protein
MSFPICPKSKAALVEAMDDGYTHATMSTLFMRVGVERWDPGPSKVNKARRAQAVVHGLEGKADADGVRMILALVTEVARSGSVAAWTSPARWWAPLVEALAGDGWDWDEGAERLVPAVEGVDVPEARNWLEQRLDQLGWDTAAAHYGQAVRALGSGDWESANAQLRSFLEAFVPAAATPLLGKPAPRDPNAALQQLDAKKMILPGEFDFARGMWKLANERGSHAGLSSRDEAQFRMLTATAWARFLLTRLPDGL